MSAARFAPFPPARTSVASWEDRGRIISERTDSIGWRGFMLVTFSSSGTQPIEKDIDDLLHVVIGIVQTCAKHRDNVLPNGVNNQGFDEGPRREI
jgi:hypothetical protein